jgi:hypothetical protein
MKDGWLKENVGTIVALMTVIGTFGLAFFLKTEREILGKRELQISGKDKRKTKSGWRIKNQ